jgi:hypothetical protein
LNTQFYSMLPRDTVLRCLYLSWTAYSGLYVVERVKSSSWFQAFAVFWMSCVTFWVVLRRMVFNSQRFGHFASTHLRWWNIHGIPKCQLLNTIHQRTTQRLHTAHSKEQISDYHWVFSVISVVDNRRQTAWQNSYILIHIRWWRLVGSLTICSLREICNILLLVQHVTGVGKLT